MTTTQANDAKTANGDFARWGYADTYFEFDGERAVRMSGARYPLAGVTLPDLIPFAEQALGLPLSPSDLQTPLAASPPPPVRNDAFVAALRERFDADSFSDADDARLRHSYGQLSVGEIYRVNRGISPARVPDLVFYPRDEKDAADLIALADSHGACLIPYGGGTNVSGALACPRDEARFIVSADMRRMNAVLWIDEKNMLARAQAGIRGADLEAALARRGFTAGHEPDSIEFSTLGGWIATLASGMKKNRYGNIEDLVIDATMLTPAGAVRGLAERPPPRISGGISPRAWLFGGEGNLGLITDAVIKIRRRPEARRYASAVFPSFRHGFAFLQELRKQGEPPASIRLVNNREFRMGQALRPAAASRRERIVRAAQRYWLLRVLDFEPQKMCACTILMEGGKREARLQERRILRLARRFGAFPGGAANGRRGYALTFAIAYIRDFLNRLNIVGETFETAAPWTKAPDICAAAEVELARQCEQFGVAGRPYLAYRITQTYHSGVCIYFTMGFHARGLSDPVGVFDEIEKRLRKTIMDNGGAISHHHGVGKVRGAFLHGQHSAAALAAVRGAKAALDPRNVFAAANGAFAKAD